MPKPTYFPTTPVWIQKTTSPNGNRMVEARSLDALLHRYERLTQHDLEGRYASIDQMLKRCNKGAEQSKEKPYLAAQFFALQTGLLAEVAKITRDKQVNKWAAARPAAGPGRPRGIHLGGHRENVALSDDYALEGADPKHRFGMFWRMAKAMAPGSANTQEALIAWANQEESAIWNQLAQQTGIRNAYVKYLSAGERWRYLLTVNNGLIYRSSDLGKDMPFSTKHAKVSDTFTGQRINRGRGIWVMSTRSAWYAGLHDTGKFHHSSFLSGEMVICGGEVIASDGCLIYLSNKTGHYKAGPKNLFNAMQNMDASLDFRGVILNLFVGNNQEFWTPAEMFLNNDGQLRGLRGFQFDLNTAAGKAQRMGLLRSIIDQVFNGNPVPPDIFGLGNQSLAPARFRGRCRPGRSRGLCRRHPHHRFRGLHSRGPVRQHRTVNRGGVPDFRSDGAL